MGHSLLRLYRILKIKQKNTSLGAQATTNRYRIFKMVTHIIKQTNNNLKKSLCMTQTMILDFFTFTERRNKLFDIHNRKKKVVNKQIKFRYLAGKTHT
jgi:hypothetical protein